MHNTDPEPFPDAPRNWRRVGTLVSLWVLVIAGGALLAPGIVAGGAEPDPRDVPPESATGAVYRYLMNAGESRDDNRERAWDTVCEDAEPELDPDVLRQMTSEAYDRLGGADGVDINLLRDQITTGEAGTVVPALYYVNAHNQGRREIFELTVTARQDGDTWCVTEVVETPTPPELIPAQLSGDYFDAIDAGDYTTATELQCDTYTGQTPEETAAITHPILKTANGTVFRDPTPYEDQSTEPPGSDLRVTSWFDYVEQDGATDVVHATFEVVVIVDEDAETSCVASVEAD